MGKDSRDPRLSKVLGISRGNAVAGGEVIVGKNAAGQVGVWIRRPPAPPADSQPTANRQDDGPAQMQAQQAPARR